MNSNIHTPILVPEIINHLNIFASDTILDLTIGFGGHAEEILTKLSTSGKYIGIDQDLTALNYSKNKFSSSNLISFHHSNFKNFPSILEDLKIKKVNKIIIDLGVSSLQLDDISRGFSYRGDAFLDMRMNSKENLTAKEVINTYSKEDLSNIFYKFGELHHNKKLVENILLHRKKAIINTTTELCELIKKSYFFNNNRKKLIKAYSQVFQALRIEVNQEFENLSITLKNIHKYLDINGIVAILSFHSLEDKLIKHYIKGSTYFEFCPKKVIKPSYNECKINPRARSAKCRIFKFKNQNQQSDFL
tara:strand:- start:90 stop:1001 length:912 start_codon:yes stop_codon:yes gene_type:complete